MRSLILAAVVMGLACGGAGQPNKNDEPAKADGPKWEGPPVEAEELYKQYSTDGAGAAAKYAGKKIRVRLRVDAAQQSSDVEMIQYLSKTSDFPRVSVYVPQSDAGKVKTGEISTFEGTIYTTGSAWVSLKGVVVP